MSEDSFFTRELLAWYELNGRDLPWRRSRDPYGVWLSEIILQQTRIVQGTAYWQRFMDRFPTVQALAAATEDEVLRLWEGLGYYSRARNLHAAARQIVALGRFPDTLDGLRSLKGVGDYSAAAIGSIAFGLPAAVLDGNVYRVLARYFGLATPVGTTAAKKEFSARAQSLLPEGRSADFNQALMDFGALQCTPASPRCGDCPLAVRCQALREGRVELLPVRKTPVAVQNRYLSWVYLRFNGRTAVCKRAAVDIWQGLWQPLLLEGEMACPPIPGTLSACGRVTLLRGGLRHRLTHRLLVCDLYLLDCARQPQLPDGYVWINEAELERYGKPKPFELLLEMLAERESI
ncbi:MAG: A/G-specific adenine glycosylase [Bacteroidales bacterium]|nr:A/G-specific adenine glycosylase [Bacteroidales bacterium]